MTKYPYEMTGIVYPTLKKVFDHLAASHSALSAWVNHSTDEQVKVKRQEELQQVHTFVDNVVY